MNEDDGVITITTFLVGAMLLYLAGFISAFFIENYTYLILLLIMFFVTGYLVALINNKRK